MDLPVHLAKQIRIVGQVVPREVILQLDLKHALDFFHGQRSVERLDFLCKRKRAGLDWLSGKERKKQKTHLSWNLNEQHCLNCLFGFDWLRRTILRNYFARRCYCLDYCYYPYFSSIDPVRAAGVSGGEGGRSGEICG